jgi:hypothetical protein
VLAAGVLLALRDQPAAVCMPAQNERTSAYKSMVVFRLGTGPGGAVAWNPRTTIPTLSSFSAIRAYAVRRGLAIEAWLFDDRAVGPLEAAAGRWREAVRTVAFPPRPAAVPSVDESLAAFNAHILPLERGMRTRGKLAVLRLAVLTWAIWKDVLPNLLPMSTDMLRAWLWDALAFEASLPVLRQSLNAIKAWHRQLGLTPPADGPGDYRRVVTSLARFQGNPQRLKWPIHAGAVRRLLLLPVPDHPPCSGVNRPPGSKAWTRCPICWLFLLRWIDCLAGATGTVLCCRCGEIAAIQSCDISWNHDGKAGYDHLAGGAAFNIRQRKVDQFRAGHHPRAGVARNPNLDLLRQLRALIDLIGNGPRPGCRKLLEPGSPCPACPPLFPRRIGRSDALDLSRQPTSAEMSQMIVRGLGHVGFDTSLFSGISARKGGLSTAIEAGVPEAILWMQSGHAQDAAARRYVRLDSPALLYRTWEAFGL